MNPLSTAVELDHKLEQAHEQTSEALAQHRWHWTLDESNPDRVSLRAYAKAIGRNFQGVRKYANGYEQWVTTTGSHSLTDCIALANVSAEKAEVAEVVAEVEGVTIDTVTNRRGTSDSLANITEMAHDAAERKGTTVADEARGIAERRVQTRAMDNRADSERKAKHTSVYISIEGNLAGAKRKLTDALNDAEDVAFSDEELELLRLSVAQVRAVLDLLDLRLLGSPDVDWDAELAKLGGAA